MPGLRPAPALPFDAAGGIHALPAAFQTMHGPLAYWAGTQGEATALRCDTQQWSYAQLHALVQTRAADIERQAPGHTPLLPMHLSACEMVIEFLATNCSGRCAAIGDAQWPDHVLHAVQASLTSLPAAPPDTPAQFQPFYVGFTSGSTGQPKGFRRHHLSWAESFRVGLADLGQDMHQHILSPGQMTHSLFLFGALMGIWMGTGATVQTQFSAAQTLLDVASTSACAVVAVPSQLLLVLQYAQRHALPPQPQVKLVLISGARWLREHSGALKALFPQARIIEFYGASEASFITWMEARADTPAQAVGQPFSNVQLRAAQHPEHSAETTQAQPIWVRSPMQFMDYVHAADGSAAQQSGPWLSVRDMGRIDANGQLHLYGREKRMLVTKGKNLFPEEVEQHLLSHPDVAHASVQALPDTLRGTQVHAVLQWRTPDAAAAEPWPGALALVQWCRSTLDAYKAPRRWWVWQGPWPQTRSGKTNHETLLATLQAAHQGRPSPHLQPWR
ncbi:AMP-binding protein [Comamonas sp.]|uniref:AMP-binding protein n=1 Tax=Comamonas sp. TaxID=34028 RepID=UPI00258DF3B0|nr:AMP-binding protein [Comamonas sp.]